MNMCRLRHLAKAVPSKSRSFCRQRHVDGQRRFIAVTHRMASTTGQRLEDDFLHLSRERQHSRFAGSRPSSTNWTCLTRQLLQACPYMPSACMQRYISGSHMTISPSGTLKHVFSGRSTSVDFRSARHLCHGCGKQTAFAMRK